MSRDAIDAIDAIGREAGFGDYAGLMNFWASSPSATEGAQVRERVAASAALDPRRGSHTTADDKARMLKSVWLNDASSPVVCARVRRLMGRQLTRHRIASALEPEVEVEVEVKSRGLMGVVRNEIAVFTYPGDLA